MGSANQTPSRPAGIWKAGSGVHVMEDHSRISVVLQSLVFSFLTLQLLAAVVATVLITKGEVLILGPRVVPGNSTYHLLLLFWWYHLIHSKNPFCLKLALMVLLLAIEHEPMESSSKCSCTHLFQSFSSTINFSRFVVTTIIPACCKK